MHAGGGRGSIPVFGSGLMGVCSLLSMTLSPERYVHVRGEFHDFGIIGNLYIIG